MTRGVGCCWGREQLTEKQEKRRELLEQIADGDTKLEQLLQVSLSEGPRASSRAPLRELERQQKHNPKQRNIAEHNTEANAANTASMRQGPGAKIEEALRLSEARELLHAGKAEALSKCGRGASVVAGTTTRDLRHVRNVQY